MGEKEEPLISIDQIKIIFSELETILGYNNSLLKELEVRVNQWNPSQCLGDIFLRFTGFLKVYTTYIKNYEFSINTLNECKKKSSKFISFLNNCKEKIPNHLDIESLLILPVQRIPRYNLLLSQLIKYTNADHKDYNNLIEATKKNGRISKLCQ
jgi:hypothetical protein